MSSDPWQTDSWQTAVAQRAIVMAVLAEDHRGPWSLAELERDAYDIAPGELQRALTQLTERGVVSEADGLVSASPSTRALDALGLIAL